MGYAMGHGLVFSIFMLCKMTGSQVRSLPTRLLQRLLLRLTTCRPGSQVYSGIAHFVSPAACLQVSRPACNLRLPARPSHTLPSPRALARSSSASRWC